MVVSVFMSPMHEWVATLDLPFLVCKLDVGAETIELAHHLRLEERVASETADNKDHLYPRSEELALVMDG